MERVEIDCGEDEFQIKKIEEDMEGLKNDIEILKKSLSSKKNLLDFLKFNIKNISRVMRENP